MHEKKVGFLGLIFGGPNDEKSFPLEDSPMKLSDPNDHQVETGLPVFRDRNG
jgi:hypothetical protein